ncbi:VanW family protein [Melissospora conviva]|uniref:VanW family protein n=1 Tax=Melissospora conviva TaxID=3388432 RepID=UPI003F7EE637
MSLPGEERPGADDRPTVQITAVTWPVAAPGTEPQPAPGTEPQPAVVSPPEPQPARRGRRLAVLAAAVTTVVVAGIAGAGSYAYSGDIPRGTQVLGVEVGGKSRAEAEAALQGELTRRAPELNAPIDVRIGEGNVTVAPQEIGLHIDVAATVDEAAGSEPSLLGRLFGSHEVPPVVRLDTEKLDALLQPVARKQGRAMTQPAISYRGTTVKVVHPEPGLVLDTATTAQKIQDSWLTRGPVEAPLVEQYPEMSRAEVDELAEGLARPAVAAPVTVKTDGGKITISPRAIAASLTFTLDDSRRLTGHVDAKRLRDALVDELPKVEREAKDATVTIAGGKPKVVPDRAGRRLDVSTLAGDLIAVLARTDDRTVSAGFRPVQAKTTAKDVAKLGIREKVAGFTTYFTGGIALPRNHNIAVVADTVDGVVIKPGEVFSLNGFTGERGYAQGYKDAPVILNGKLVPAVGGGISQFTTTLFNAIYYAGLEDVFHQPHSYWYSRYPSVIESTIFYPSLDFKFRNNTPNGIVLDTSYNDSSITVTVWGTKVYDKVTTEWGPKRNISNPRTVHLEDGPSCLATNGTQGFSQDAWRIFVKNGKEVKRERFSWTYDAEPRYICRPKSRS